MPIIGVLLNPGNTGANVSELHKQLLAVGAVLDSGEQTATNFGPSTLAAVSAFRERYGLPAADAVDLPTARLMHVASTFADTEDQGALRAAVREAAAAPDTSQPQALYWLARYATIAGDYEQAHAISQLIPDHPGVRDVLGPILAPPPSENAPPFEPRPPELPYPENFYTYRYKLLPQEKIDELLGPTDPSAPDPNARMRRQAVGLDEEGEWPNDLPDEPEPDPQPETPLPTPERAKALRESAESWLKAVKEWQSGNEEFIKQRYESAVFAYTVCQKAGLNYFAKLDGGVDLTSGTLEARVRRLVAHLTATETQRSHMWDAIRQRRLMLTLEELGEHDWRAVTRSAVALLTKNLSGAEGVEADGALRQRSLDKPLLILMTVFVPLARAEANRDRRQYPAANADLLRVLTQFMVRTGEPTLPFRNVFFTCNFIERPFAQLLRAETLLDQADAEYKARTPAAPAPPAPDVTGFQSLKAAQTYMAVKNSFNDVGSRYVSDVETAATELTGTIQARLADNDTSSPEFQLLGKDIHIETITSASATLPGLDRTKKAHERLLTFTPQGGQAVMRETNPRVYAALLTATARLEQLKAGFNYLGYQDTYVPPWRFQFLLERARYFAEHAKNAQRDYLNFLSNAEREDSQELSVAQNVEMEKSNIRVETARVDQVRLEVESAKASQKLAQDTAQNANARHARYEELDKRADDLAGTGKSASLLKDFYTYTSIGGLIGKATGGLFKEVTQDIASGIGDFYSGGSVSRAVDRAIASEQREYEKFSLGLAAQEAGQAAVVAQRQLAVAESGLVVAGLQRQAALLRHEFALQNLEFLRNRILNAEQWYRLVARIRSVSETYLRYSVELAFLAEQAYEFEADKRINVIRFDYDLSDVGDFLAADFLLRDLDTLEQDLIVTQRQRQQQVRYVLSMAREFPEALQEIRDSGKTTFSLRLEQLEKRFPGLYNLRIGAVDVLPVALMDSTRFSLELTHLGTSQVRLKAQPDTPPGTPSSSPLNTNDLPVPAGGWLAELQETWPVKLRVTGPETAVFSGLTRQDANTVFAFATTGQRHAFEALGAAAAWQVDFTARDNQVVPGTLADLLITLTISGYHDPDLRRAIDTAPRTTTAVTRWLSGRTTFPDAFYELNRSGRMVWNVTRDLLTLTDTLGAVRNLAVLLLPAPGRANYFGRVMSQYQVQVRIATDGNMEILSEIPQVTFTLGGAANPLSLTTQAILPAGAEISWEFGDGSARQTGADQQHSYAKPGRYTVSLQVVRNGRLSEFRGDVVVSRLHAEHLSPPVTAFPTLTRATGIDVPDGHTRVVGTVNATVDDPVIANWRVGDQRGMKGNSATFDLKSGDYTLFFVAVRMLKARVFSQQRHLPRQVFDFNGLSLASNRRFDLSGTETTGVGDNPPANPVAAHLFAEGALSPVDEWTVEVPLADNACLRSVSAMDVEQYGLAEIQDVVLALEYETTPGSS